MRCLSLPHEHLTHARRTACETQRLESFTGLCSTEDVFQTPELLRDCRRRKQKRGERAGHKDPERCDEHWETAFLKKCRLYCVLQSGFNYSKTLKSPGNLFIMSLFSLKPDEEEETTSVGGSHWEKAAFHCGEVEGSD